jgi:drug/metabolite transporter (DMT)-like permease
VSPAALFLPIGAGLGYACGAIAIKRALGAGASGGAVNLLCNSLMAFLFQLLWLLPGRVSDPVLLLAPLGCGLLFFLGQVFTFRAISTGDISVATPLLGTKVVLVALFSVFLIGKPLPGLWWIASMLASVGIALISYMPGGSHRRLVVTVGWSFAAASVFALTDVCVQKWVPSVGYSRFAPVMFGSMGILSLVYLPSLITAARSSPSQRSLFHGFPRASLPWLLGGALLLAVQALAMYSAIGLHGSATLTNILYGSRCLWSVLLVWILGVAAGDSPPREKRFAIMARRFLGALLLLGAMALVLR